MSCDTVEPELVAYHFGAISPEARQRVEAHLPGCASCLRAFITLKRNMEMGEGEPLPSKGVRERLRSAVARELRASAPAPAPVRTWRWWERPLALGGALAVLMGAIFVTSQASSGQGIAPRTLSRPVKGTAGAPSPEG
jgi:anti-sigma factor RsiW